MMKLNRAIISFLGFLSLVSFTACATAVTKNSEDAAGAQGKAKGNEPYRITISKKKVVTMEDGCRAVLAVAKADDLKGHFSEDDYKSMVEQLKSMAIMPVNWNMTADTPITKSKVAIMLVRTLGIKGGAVARIVGMNERYAYQECRFLDLISGGGQNRYFDGIELIAIVHRATFFKEHGSLDNLEEQ